MSGVSMGRRADQGTGKTRFLERQIARDAEAWGSDNVLALSFTNAAAREIAGRHVPLPAGNVGTLHRFAYEAIDRPPLAESGELLKRFNETHPTFAVTSTGDVTDLESQATSGTDGADLLAEYSRLRNLERPRELWPTDVTAFARAWEGFKRDTESVDFTDMIDIALAETGSPAQCPQVMIVDEAQDCTVLQLRLVWRWALNVEKVVMALDSDQTLYSWAGAHPEMFLSVPPKGEKVLSQSYRVPRAVHALSQRWIRRVRARKDVEYRPRDADGRVSVSGANWKQPEIIMEELRPALDAGRSCMVMTSCAYMLEPLVAVLRDRRMPFGNRWRLKRGDWNPLSRRGDGSTVARVLDFLAPWRPGAERLWTTDQVLSWLGLVKDVLVRKGRARVDDLPVHAGEEDVLHALLAAMREGELDLATQMPPECLEWMVSRLRKPKQRVGRYVCGVAAAHGADVLDSDPLLSVGTIHSFKGSEAECVWAAPDLSARGWEQWTAGDRDAILRQFYVAFTRAKCDLRLLSPAGPMAVSW